MIEPKEKFMREAIRQAQLAKKEGDYAVGAVLVRDGEIIAACNNRSKRDESPIAHAETLAILEGCKLLNSRHLPDCILYTTHEPCPMCSSVIVWARLKGVVHGARYEDMRDYRENHPSNNYLWRTIDISFQEIVDKSTEKVEIVRNFLRDDCIKLFHS